MDREELLRSARNLYENPGTNEALKVVLEETYPELKESEEERIRKFLVKHVSEWIGCIEHDLKISSKDVESEEELAMFKAGLAYLEKQKEKTNQTQAEREYVRTLKSLIADFLRGKEEIVDKTYYQDIYNWLDGYYVEQQPAEWSEEDEAKKERLISIVKRALHGNEYPLLNDNGATELITWLKSLRPQPGRRDTYYDIIHNILDTLKDIDFMKITPEHRVSLLNDIRVKCKNADECAAILDEPDWKPSEIQMKALLSKLPVVKGGGDKIQDILESLYDDLKKL